MVSRAVSIVYRLQLRINLSLSVVNWFRSWIAFMKIDPYYQQQDVGQ